MYPKKVGTHVFYKETKKLGEYIFKALSNRGRQKDQKTLNQALENMKLTWATISRY